MTNYLEHYLGTRCRKYTSEIALKLIVTLWKVFSKILNNSELMSGLVEGRAKKILLKVALNYIVGIHYCENWILWLHAEG